MNEDLATHISLLAAPIFAALIADGRVRDDQAYRALAAITAIRLARELWKATLEAAG